MGLGPTLRQVGRAEDMQRCHLHRTCTKKTWRRAQTEEKSGGRRHLGVSEEKRKTQGTLAENARRRKVKNERSAEKKIAGGITSGFPAIKDNEEWKRWLINVGTDSRWT